MATTRWPAQPAPPPAARRPAGGQPPIELEGGRRAGAQAGSCSVTAQQPAKIAAVACSVA
jgi:hypothetical protein